MFSSEVFSVGAPVPFVGSARSSIARAAV